MYDKTKSRWINDRQAVILGNRKSILSKQEETIEQLAEPNLVFIPNLLYHYMYLIK